jgi:hypothetical protein
MAKKQNTPVKQFGDWLPEEVEQSFKITLVQHLPELDTLCAIKAKNIEQHTYYDFVEDLRSKARLHIEGWNEDEYKFFIISPFLALVNFFTPYYSVFTQRQMSLLYDNGTKKTEGRVEWMLARGRQIPQNPHLFLQEYKPERRRDNDPLGQVLIAMVCAQLQNEDDKPIYGMYVNGRNWFLVVLQGKQYAVSDPYTITTNDIFDLFAVLEFLKVEMIKLYQ